MCWTCRKTTQQSPRQDSVGSRCSPRSHDACPTQPGSSCSISHSNSPCCCSSFILPQGSKGEKFYLLTGPHCLPSTPPRAAQQPGSPISKCGSSLGLQTAGSGKQGDGGWGGHGVRMVSYQLVHPPEIRARGPGKIRKVLQLLMLGGPGEGWGSAGVMGKREEGNWLGLSGRDRQSSSQRSGGP